MKKLGLSRKTFLVSNNIFLVLVALLCIAPMINVLAVSFSSSAPAAAGFVTFWPVQFTLKAYEMVFRKPDFIKAFVVSAERLVLGVPINLFLTVLVAYPLSKNKTVFKAKNFYAWLLMITMLFSGGLIPTYMVVSYTGLMDSIWALILPGALPVFYVIILLNFFKGIPPDIAEAAYIDGSGHWNTLWKIYLPLSTPVLATLVLFCAVGHWNSWFDGLIYMNRPEHYPLQSYLQTIISAVGKQNMSLADIQAYANVSERTSKAAQIFITALPILLLYPFLQKYFITGMTLGSVKG